jgi:hypothetical protein
MVVRVVDFDPQCDPARPSPTRSGPVRPVRPWRPCPPHARPLPQIHLPHLISPAQQPFSLSPISLCLSRGALGFRDGDRRSWIPEVSSPPLPSLLLSLPLPPLLFPARALPFSPTRVPLPPARRPSPRRGLALPRLPPTRSRVRNPTRTVIILGF